MADITIADRIAQLDPKDRQFIEQFIEGYVSGQPYIVSQGTTKAGIEFRVVAPATEVHLFAFEEYRPNALGTFSWITAAFMERI